MNYFDWVKVVLLLAVIVLGLVAILWHKQITREEPPVQVEYKFMNLNI